MNNTMKRRMIAFVAAIAAVVSLSGWGDNYEDWAQIASEEDEYEAFLEGSK